MTEKSLLGAADPLIGLLRLLGQGGLVTAAEAARRLGASEALVMAMVDGLQRRGYVAPLAGCGAAACGGCGLAAACRDRQHPLAACPGAGAGPALALALTEKGWRAAARLPAGE